MDTQSWDDRYRGTARLFSGAPNGVLVAEVTDLPPGQALDVGCGEGADAVWLARRGWLVTAVDVSPTALRRGAASARDVADRVTWTQGDVTATAPPRGAFDLVTVSYVPLPKQQDHAAPRGLLDAVAPGGTLLVTGHAPAGLSSHHDLSAYYQPAEVASLLDGGWTVLVDETRPRTAPTPTGTHHTHDTVLRARRLR